MSRALFQVVAHRALVAMSRSAPAQTQPAALPRAQDRRARRQAATRRDPEVLVRRWRKSVSTVRTLKSTRRRDLPGSRPRRRELRDPALARRQLAVRALRPLRSGARGGAQLGARPQREHGSPAAPRPPPAPHAAAARLGALACSRIVSVSYHQRLDPKQRRGALVEGRGRGEAPLRLRPSSSASPSASSARQRARAEGQRRACALAGRERCGLRVAAEPPQPRGAPPRARHSRPGWPPASAARARRVRADPRRPPPCARRPAAPGRARRAGGRRGCGPAARRRPPLDEDALGRLRLTTFERGARQEGDRGGQWRQLVVEGSLDRRLGIGECSVKGARAHERVGAQHQRRAVPADRGARHGRLERAVDLAYRHVEPVRRHRARRSHTTRPPRRGFRSQAAPRRARVRQPRRSSRGRRPAWSARARGRRARAAPRGRRRRRR